MSARATLRAASVGFLLLSVVVACTAPAPAADTAPPPDTAAVAPAPPDVLSAPAPVPVPEPRAAVPDLGRAPAADVPPPASPDVAAAAPRDVPPPAPPDVAAAAPADVPVPAPPDAGPAEQAAAGEVAAPAPHSAQLAPRTTPPAPHGDVAIFVLDGHVVERRAPFAFFAPERSLPVREFLEKMAKVAEMTSVGTILLRIGAFDPGPAQLAELRAAVRAAREKGRRVIAHLESGGQAGYLLASAADEIHLSHAADLDLHGVELDVVYLRGLLDKLGLQFDVEAIGRYKTGFEQFTRRTMSPEQHEELSAYADAVFDEVVGAAARGKLSTETARALVDAGPYPADEALRLGLVDALTDWRELRQRVREDSGGTVAVQYPETAQKPDLSSFMGMLSLFSHSPEEPPPNHPKIAVLYAVGPIEEGDDPQAELWGEETVQTGRMLAAIAALRKDHSVKGVVLRIDSPGGSALASDILWNAIRELRTSVPVVASLGDVAASGGYYLASATDAIVAEPTTLTGSIGVLGGKVVVRGLQDLVGVSAERISRGQNAGMLSPYQPFTEAERTRLRTLLGDTYARFVARVAEGRGRSRAEIAAVAEGRVWTGADAHERGLVDELGGLSDALAMVRTMAKVAPDLPAYSYPAARSLMELLQEGGGHVRMGGVRALLAGFLGLPLPQLALAQDVLAGLGLREAVSAVDLLRTLRRESVLLHAPWILNVR